MPQLTRILIACHRPYPIPQNSCYLPVEVGAALHTEPIPGTVPDNTGDNISHKNKNYCELTALYWAWKNLEAEAVGLVHYRRYFAKRGIPRRIADETDFQEALQKAPVILPAKRHYWIETNYSQYIHAHHEQDLAITREVLAECCPDYLPTYEREMAKRSGHRFNMFVMRSDCFRDYCKWLFPILFEIEVCGLCLVERRELEGFFLVVAPPLVLPALTLVLCPNVVRLVIEPTEELYFVVLLVPSVDDVGISI